MNQWVFCNGRVDIYILNVKNCGRNQLEQTKTILVMIKDVER